MKIKCLVFVVLVLFLPLGVSSQNVRGDVNYDGKVSISDAINIIDYLLSKESDTLWDDSISTAEHMVSIPMQGGMIDEGYTVGNLTKLSQFTKNCHSIPMMNIENCEIVDVITEADESLTIFYYGASGDYLGSVSSVDNLPDDAVFVKFMVNKSIEYDTVPSLKIMVKGSPTFSKNDVPEKVALKYFSFETDEPKYYDETEMKTDGDTLRYYDNGFVKLPPNYSRDGEAVPLVVYVHGTNGYGFSSGPRMDGSAGDYGSLQDFIVNNGFALCDCSGLTNKYKSVGNAYAAPSFKSSIENMVKFLIANYNIREDGIFVYGKSSGGFIAHMLALDFPYKIKAVGSLAPALSPMVSMAHHAWTYTATANMEAEQIGVDYTFTSAQFNDDDKAAMIDNVDLWRKIDPFFSGTDFTDEQVAQIVSLCYSAGGSSEHLNISDISEAVELCDSANRWTPCPTEIWIAEDDWVVFHGNSKLFVEMAQRTGSPCYLRTMPKNTGGHHAVDTADNALKVNYITKYAGVVEIPAAYAELVDWFNRWR